MFASTSDEKKIVKKNGLNINKSNSFLKNLHLSFFVQNANGHYVRRLLSVLVPSIAFSKVI